MHIRVVLKLTDEQLDWLLGLIPEAPRSPKGGRMPADKRKTARGIFWILDNGAKWKDLPRRFGPKSTVPWTRSGVLEQILRDAGRLVEERVGYRVYKPLHVIGDKAYDSDQLAERLGQKGVELIAPHRSNRKPGNKAQDRRALRRYKGRWTVERTIGWFQNFRRL
jgi:transposase